MFSLSKFVIVIVSTIFTVHVSLTCELSKACYPPIKDLFRNLTDLSARFLSVNATCANGTVYMSVSGLDTNEYTCNPSLVQPENMADYSKDTYWQSGKMIEKIEDTPIPQMVEFNFTDDFIINTVLIRFKVLHRASNGPSADARPAAWTIQKYDKDGDTWRPCRHFARNCALAFPGVPVLDPYSTNIDYVTVFCHQYVILEDGESFSDYDNELEFYPGLLDAHEDLFKNVPEAARMFTTSAIRLVFLQPPSLLPLSSYVAVSRLIIDGQCPCNGHASSCSGPNEATCDCQHFTKGPGCDGCLPLYNDRMWIAGNTSQSGACHKCTCNDHADSCNYDKVKDYGVCNNCRDNSTGDFCDKCVEGYYVNSTWTPNLDAATRGSFCLDCDCDPMGTKPESLATCNMTSGQCECKARVTSRDCSQCNDTFWGLDASKAEGCSTCDCDPNGSLQNANSCNKTTGACLCKTNVDGLRCNICKTNTYNFDINNEEGCTPCGCDPGASAGQSCNVTTGQCVCRSNIGGLNCTDPLSGFYVPRLDLMILEPEMDENQKVHLRPGHGSKGSTVSGRGLVTFDVAQTLVLTLTSKYDGPMDVVLRYETTSPDSVMLIRGSMTLISSTPYQCGGQTVNPGKVWTLGVTLVDKKTRDGVKMGPVCLKSGQIFSISLTNDGSLFRLDSVVLVPDLTTVTSTLTGLLDPVNVDQCQTAAIQQLQANRQSCLGLEYSLMAAYLDGAVACSCASGSVVPQSSCDPFSGDCDCRTGVLPPGCNTCLVEFYQFSMDTGCIPCDCNTNGSQQLYCDTTGGCTCLPNVKPSKCDACIANHYGLYTGKGCTECQCSPSYAINNDCNDFGKCQCKPGVSGNTCDACAEGHYNLTTDGCTECTCHPQGSTNKVCNVETGVCQCLANVEGASCNLCKPDYFGLGQGRGGDCIPCFCWNKTTSCSSARGWFNAPIVSKWLTSDPQALQDKWMALDDNGMAVVVDTPTVTTLNGQEQYVMRVNVASNNSSAVYFVATDRFLGNRMSSYGRLLSIQVLPYNVSGLSPADAPTGMADVIIESDRLALALYHTWGNMSTVGEQTIQIKMEESQWRVGNNNQSTIRSQSDPIATYQQMMEALSSVTGLKILAYPTQIGGFTLQLVSVAWEGATPSNTSEPEVSNVEQCQCPWGYTGASCEMCASGYTRRVTNSTDPYSKCVPCSCNGHSSNTPCDPVSGVCVCTHHTVGEQCEQCAVGYYGNATRGSPDDCLPCGCPGIIVMNEINVFATSCEADASGIPVCKNCTEGHEGNQCQSCKEGYFGTPDNATNVGGKCLICDCNGRADTCNRRTGECIACRDNTTGQTCNLCAPGFYGDAMTSMCQECICKQQPGSTGECDATSGQCVCLPNVEGFSCDQCKDGTFNLTAGIGCEPCDCQVNGSESSVCNKTDGQCKCRTRVQGRQCNKCLDGFWNINDVTGCDPCQCNVTGSATTTNGTTVETCDVLSGQCQCALPGIAGRTCDRCLPATENALTYVNLFYLGSFPQCELCGECFDTLSLKIDVVGKQMNDFHEKSLAIWSKYDNQTASQISASLTNTEEKINRTSDSISSFQKMTEDLQELQTNFTHVSTRDDALSTRIDKLAETEQTLVDRLRVTVAMSDQLQVSTTMMRTLEQMYQQMNSTMVLAQNSMNQGGLSWTSIQTLSIVVAPPEQRAEQLRQQREHIIKVSNMADSTFKTAEIIYNTFLRPGVESNQRLLASSGQKLTEATAMLLEMNTVVVSIGEDISMTRQVLEGIQQPGKELKTKMLGTVQDLQGYVANASLAQSSAYRSSGLAKEYQTLTTNAQETMVKSMATILENLASLQQVQSDTIQAQIRSTSVLNGQLRPESDMLTLIQDIGRTKVTVSDVEKVNLEAQKALFTAQEALKDTQAALVKARELNQGVEQMKSDITESQNLRVQTSGLKMAADSLDSETRMVLNKANAHINQTLKDMESIKQDALATTSTVKNLTNSLASAQSEVSAAVASANQADERAKTAFDAQESLLQVMVEINKDTKDQDVASALSTMTQADASMRQMDSDLEALMKLTDMDVLLQDLKGQNEELRLLEGEIDQMTTTLNELVVSLEEAVGGISCV